MVTRQRWIELFETVIGRLPSAFELQKGLESDFQPSKIQSIAKLSEQPNSNVEINNLGDTNNLEKKTSLSQTDVEEPIYDVMEEPTVFPNSEIVDTSHLENNQHILQTDVEGPIYDVMEEPTESLASNKEELYDVIEEPPFEQEKIDSSPTSSLSSTQSESFYDVVENSMDYEKLSNAKQHFQNLSEYASEAFEGKTKRQNWLAAFEHYVGRKPTAEEFLIGRDQDYDITTIHQFLKSNFPLVKSTMTKRQQKLIYLSVIVVVVFGIIYFALYQTQFSRQSVMDHYLKTVKQNKEKAIDYQAWSDNFQPISKSDLTYTNLEKITYPKDKSLLLSDESMKRIGQKYLIFPNWKVLINPVEAKVTSNTKGLDITINGKKWKTTKNDHFSQTLTRLYPGEYDFSASGKINNQDISISNQKDLTSTKEISLDVSYLNFTVKSNLSDGDLYMGSLKMGTLSHGELQVTNAPVNNSSSIYVKKTFANGSQIKSTTKRIDDISDGDTVTLDSDSVLNRDTANRLLESAYAKLQSYAYRNTNPDGLDDIFEDGINNRFYSDVANMIDDNTIHAKKRKASSVTFSDVDVTKVVQTGSKSYVADFTVVNDFYYSSDKNHDSYGDIKQKIAWSVKIEKKASDSSYNSSDDYRITDVNGESKVLSTENTVS